MAWGRGEELFSAVSPWVAVVVNKEAGRRCPGCFLPRAPDPDIECPNCLLVCYCSWACRAKDLRHKSECAFLANAGRLPDRDEVRVMVQALGKLMGSQGGDGIDLLGGGGEGDLVPGRKERRTFAHLMSWADEFLGDDERRENIKIVFDETEDFLGPAMPSFDIFVEVLGRLYINGFEICDEKMSTYGWGVFLGPSILDHSCRPNAAVSFTGSLLTVRALQPLDSLEDALITYVDPDLPGPARREKLQSNYFFLCGCVKCKHTSGREREANMGSKKEKEVGEKKRRQRGRK